jgi:GT2 family glycosyltransferase
LFKLIYGGEEVLDVKKPPVPPEGNILKDLLFNNFILIMTAMVKREVVEKIGMFDENFRRLEDYDFWIRTAAAGFEFGFLPEALAIYRITPGSLSRNSVKMIAAQRQVYKKLYNANLIKDVYLLRILRQNMRKYFLKEIAWKLRSYFRKLTEIA